MKDRIERLLESKGLEYNVWPLLETEDTKFRSLLIDNQIFSQLCRFLLDAEYYEGEIDEVCLEVLKDDTFTTFVLFLNGLPSHFTNLKKYQVPNYSTLWSLLKDYDTSPRPTTFVEPPPTLKQDLQQSVVMLSRQYKDLTWLMNVIMKATT